MFILTERGNNKKKKSLFVTNNAPNPHIRGGEVNAAKGDSDVRVIAK